MNNPWHFGVLFLVFSLLSRSSCEILFACANDGSGLVTAQNLAGKGFDIYGFYDNTLAIHGSLVIASPQATLSLSSEQAEEKMQPYCSYVVELGETSNVEEYFVLERQELFGVTFTEALTIQGANPLHSSFNRVVVAAKDRKFFPDNVEVLPVPTTPIQLGIRGDLLPIVEEIYGQASRKYTVAPVATIKELVDAVNAEDLKGFVTYLTGEDPSSTILTRNSVSQGAKDASLWIQKQFDSFGLKTSLLQFRTDYSPNVLGIKQAAASSRVVVIGAHYDSRGPTSTSPTQRAPGANDNGSGTGAILQIAKLFNNWNATFEFNIHFIAYSGEEQGLYGSAAYATQLVNEKVDVVGVINADMVAYRVPTEATQCAFPSRYSTPALETLARQATATYVPTLTIGITTACCSDHQSYYNRGFPATGFFERNGAIADPQYHKSEDLVARTGYDISASGQYVQLTKAILATVATVANIEV